MGMRDQLDTIMAHHDSALRLLPTEGNLWEKAIIARCEMQSLSRTLALGPVRTNRLAEQ